ncbi:MAG: toll/interleukin-1 receptor domain-containing protein [Bradyrhizobium sp.]
MRRIKLFVSYCRADTEPRPGFNVSRVGRILDEVKYELGCHSSRSRFEILRDVEMVNVAENFRDKIRQAIAECDMAILFISENFCRSEECEAEFAELIRTGKPLFLVETESPLFDDDEDRIKPYRDAVKDVLFAKFWGLDNNKRPVRFGFPIPDNSPTRTQYYEVLEALVTGLKIRAARIAQAGSDQDDPYAILLACPTPDVKAEAMRLAKTLDERGHTVHAFDVDLDIGNAETFAAAFSRALAHCDAYVQLLGTTPGKTVPGTDQRLVRAQYEMAKQAGKPSFIWRAADFDGEEVGPLYAAFLKDIASTCMIGSFVEFEEYLRKKLNDLTAQQRSSARCAAKSQAADVAASLPFVAIDAASADSDLAQKIADALANYVNVDHLDYDLTGQKLADAVADNNGLILAYGTSAEGQKRTQAHFKLIRRPTQERGLKGIELAVGNGAPSSALPCPRGPNVHVITVADEVDGAAMALFLSKLGIAVPRPGEAG